MELFAAKYEMDYRALNERLLTKEQRPWMPPVTISLRLALNERLLPKEQRHLGGLTLVPRKIPLNERLLPKEQRRARIRENKSRPGPSMKGCSRKSSDTNPTWLLRSIKPPLNERLLPKEQRPGSGSTSEASAAPQ